jgi:hypothetical protein
LCLNYRTLIEVSEFRLLRGLCGFEREEGTEGGRKLQSVALRDLYRIMEDEWARDVACMEE